MNALGIATQGIGPHRHGTVDPVGNLREIAAQQVASEARGDFQRQADVAGSHTLLQLGMTVQWRALNKIAGTGQLQRVGLAVGGLVPVQYGEGQVVHIHVDAVPHDHHQQNRAGQCEQRTQRIALEFHRLPAGIAEHSAQTETGRALFSVRLSD